MKPRLLTIYQDKVIPEIKSKFGIIIQKENNFYKVDNDWDEFVNDDNLPDKIKKISHENEPLTNGQELIDTGLKAPIGSQELWASGVTYLRSKVGRQEESKKAVLSRRTKTSARQARWKVERLFA